MGSQTNAPLILSIFGFYIVLVTIMGLVGAGLVGSTSFAASTISSPTTNPLTIFTAITYFFNGLGLTLSALPAWANTLLFLPLGVTVLYVVASFVRGSS